MGNYQTGAHLYAQNALSEITRDPILRQKLQSNLSGGVTPKAIVNGSATSLIDAMVDLGWYAGGQIRYVASATDGTDVQAITGIVTYALVNKAGTVTATITEVAANQAKAVSAGTYTLAWTIVAGTGKATIKLQPTTSLTATAHTVAFSLQNTYGSVTVL